MTYGIKRRRNAKPSILVICPPALTAKTRMGMIIENIPSRRMILEETLRGLTVADNPVISPILQTIDPKTTPRLIPEYPFKAVETATRISGRLTVTDTNISPTNDLLTPIFLAIGISESVNQSEPLPIARILTTIKNIGISKSTSYKLYDFSINGKRKRLKIEALNIEVVLVE